MNLSFVPRWSFCSGSKPHDAPEQYWDPKGLIQVENLNRSPSPGQVPLNPATQGTFPASNSNPISRPMFQTDVVERCKANDRKAQLTLYRQYCDGMFRVAMRYVKDVEDAEDLLQETFIKAFQKIGQFQGDVTFGAWLKRIVINHCIDFLKSKRWQSVAFDERYMHVEEDGDWSVDETTTMADITAAMERLPDKYRYVVMMFLLEGFDHREIAQVLNLTETASRTRLLRGKGFLRKLLKKERHGTGS